MVGADHEKYFVVGVLDKNPMFEVKDQVVLHATQAYPVAGCQL